MSSLMAWNIDEEVKIRMEDKGPASVPARTVMEVFDETVRKYGNQTAMNVKRNGEYQKISYKEYQNNCKSFAKSLIHVGVERFDGVCIIGFNAPEWITADVGAIYAGAVASGIYTTNNPSACEYIAKHSDSAVAVVEGVMQLEKFLAIQDNLPKLKAIVVYNEAVPAEINSKVPVYAFDDFLKLGSSVEDSKLQERIDAQKPGHCCTLIYTSGTTGDPKAVMLSHDNMCWTVNTVIEMLQDSFNITVTNEHRMVSYLPLSHVAAQMLDIMLPISSGVQVFFAMPDALKGSLGVTLKEVRPSLFFAVPRVWEKIAEKMWAIGAQTTGLKKRIATWAKDKGSKKTAMAQFGSSGGAPCGYGVANALVLGRIKEALGLDQCHACFSGAAPISREIIDYFGSLDLPIFEFFGQSETSAPQTSAMRGAWKIGSCGRTIAGSHTQVVKETGELIFQGRNTMMGYLKGEQQTKDTIDEEGWLHSGDVGTLDQDGFMTITGRIKELIITAGGENVPPVLIEDIIKEEIPLLSNAMVIGDRRKFLTALFTFRVEIDAEGVPTEKLDAKALSICKEIGSSATTVAEAKQCAKVKEYLDAGLKKANSRATSRAQNVGKYHILDRDFSVGGGELTPTLKLRRKIVNDMYTDIIEGMYA